VLKRPRMDGLMATSRLEPGRVIPFPREGLVKKAALADHFQVSPRTVERWVADGMPCHRLGGSVRYRISECEAWLEEGQR
jgi:hypothetical protein